MADKKRMVTPETDAGKTISAQLSDLRLEHRAVKKLHSSQQAQMNEMQTAIGTMWKRIGM